MTAPNLRVPTSIIGKTTLYSPTLSLVEVLANSSNSGSLFKVNTIRAANTSDSSSVSVDVTLYRGTTHSYIIKNVLIPSGKALIISDKNEYIYLEEGDSLYISANAPSSVDIMINYEQIS